MDTMDYGYFAGAGNQQYQFGNYNLDAGLLAGGAPTDTTLSTPVCKLQTAHSFGNY